MLVAFFVIIEYSAVSFKLASRIWPVPIRKPEKQPGLWHHFTGASKTDYRGLNKWLIVNISLTVYNWGLLVWDYGPQHVDAANCALQGSHCWEWTIGKQGILNLGKDGILTQVS